MVRGALPGADPRHAHQVPLLVGAAGHRVLVVGGPPGAGKTTLGQAVAAELGLAFLTVDDLRVAARALTTEATHPALHAAGAGHTAYFTVGPPGKLVADARALHETMWPAVERVIRHHAAYGPSLVVEGWVIPPDAVARLDLPGVRSVWLTVDPAALWERERANTGFVAGSHDPDRMLANFMHRSLWHNDLVGRTAADLGLPVIHQRGHRPVPDLVAEVLRAVGWAAPPPAT